MTRSPILATVVVVALLIGTPVALVRRLIDGVLPTQAYDIVLLVGVVAWIYVVRAVIDRAEPLRALVENRLSPTWQANHLVEQSAFGVGLTSRALLVEPAPELTRLHPAPTDVRDLLPSPGGDAALRADAAGSSAPRLEPTLGSTAPTAPPIIETQEYVVQRGDTFWSIAEQRLGDGRLWQSIEAVNLDREVAPGVTLLPGATLRIGWSVLVPRPAASTNAAAGRA